MPDEFLNNTEIASRRNLICAFASLSHNMTEEVDINWAKDREEVLEEWDEYNLSSVTFLRISAMNKCQTTSKLKQKCGKMKLSQACASELISKAESSSQRATSSRIPYCICRSGRPRKVTLRNTTLIEERITIVALTKVKYSENNPTHWEMLVSIYKHIVDDWNSRTEVKRFGNHWETIGFQGK
uniref:ELMO domain-containing protein n=1 Tax=Ascaris lumbricoides TaxID=6252 RepID=A0A0M3IUE5_ASCLU